MFDLQLLAFIAQTKIQKLHLFVAGTEFKKFKLASAKYLDKTGNAFFTGGLFGAFINQDQMWICLAAALIGFIQMQIADKLNKK
ncbi:hypothetical protein [Vibrio sp. 10N.239.312.D08]|uniref:hypothetical protein n=1 Tax=Vibrio sp. 10N.239.312.D08 TaxID=3229978 RepID=UPI00354FA435